MIALDGTGNLARLGARATVIGVVGEDDGARILEVALARIAQQAGLDARPLSGYAVGRTGRPGLVVGYGHLRPGAAASAVAEMARAVSG